LPSILDSLTPAARAAYPAIQRGVREGLSTTRIQNALRAAGMGVRRQVLLDVIRLERGLTDYGKILRSFSRSVPIVGELLPPALTRTRRGFSYTVELRGRDRFGGLSVQHVTVSTDNPALTPQQITDRASELGVAGRDRYGMEPESATIVRGMRAGASGAFTPGLGDE